MTTNAGDSIGGRFKAKVTRQMNKGTKPPAMTATLKPATSSPDNATTAMPKKVAKSRTFRFMGSMKTGGHIRKTGLYLMHAGEHVRPARNPMSRRGG